MKNCKTDGVVNLHVTGTCVFKYVHHRVPVFRCARPLSSLGGLCGRLLVGSVGSGGEGALFYVPLSGIQKHVSTVPVLLRNVPYHSRAHACDVMSMMQWLMETSFIDSVTTCLDHFMTLMAGAIHDVGHLGRTNAFLSSTMAPVAIRYNDRQG